MSGPIDEKSGAPSRPGAGQSRADPGASTTDGHERRAEERAACDLEAKIELDGGFVIACRIKDLSPEGFRLQVADAVRLPEAFDLLLPVIEGTDQRCRARMVWRNADMVGGAFVARFGR